MIDRLLSDHRVLVCTGSGGVGKTTLSVALGIAATRRGQRALVLSVDPARRLASALGLNRIDGEPVEIVTPHRGRLWISMLDSEAVFTHFIDHAEVAEVDKQRLKHNRLFRQLATTLSGSQEFTALLWLQQLEASGQYDLIIVDTPPCDHAIDFLHAPERIAALFEGRMTQYFAAKMQRRGVLNALLRGGGQLWLKALSKLTGAEFIDAVSDFVLAMGPFSALVAARSRAVDRLLKSDQTVFCLVVSPDPGKLQQGSSLQRALQLAGYRLRGLIINRAYPCWFLDSVKPATPLQQRMRSYFDQRISAVRGSALIQQGSLAYLELPELSTTLVGMEPLAQLADYLEGHLNPAADLKSPSHQGE